MSPKSENKKAAEEVRKVVDKVDTLFVNAGIADSYIPITVLEEDDIERHFRTNVYGAIFTSRQSILFSRKVLTRELCLYLPLLLLFWALRLLLRDLKGLLRLLSTTL